MNAVENILKMEKYEQKYKIVNIIFEKIFKVGIFYYLRFKMQYMHTCVCIVLNFVVTVI